MKKFLFTLAALMMVGTAFADDYMFLEDLELTQEEAQNGVTKNMFVKAHFETMVSAFQAWAIYPDGVTVTGMNIPNAGKIKCYMYVDVEDEETGDIVSELQQVTWTPGITGNADFTTFVGLTSMLEHEFAYIDGEVVDCGAVKWQPGEFNIMRLTVVFPAGFEGGDITFITEPSCTPDPRGEICPKGQHHEKVCHVTVEGGEEPVQTPAPVINVTPGDDSYIFEAVGEGELTLYLDGNPVENPYTVVRTEEDQTVKFTAVAHVDGQIDGSVTSEFLVPALPVVEPEDLTGEIVIGEPDENGQVEVGYNGDEEVTIVVTVNGEVVEVVDGVITVPEGESEIVVTVSAEGYNDLTDTKTVTYTAPEPPEPQDLTGEIVIGEPNEEGQVEVGYNGDEEVTIVVTVNGEVVEVVDGMITVPEGESEIVVTVSAEGYNDLTDTKTVEYTAPVEPQPTEMPVITYEVTDDAVVITATGEGEVLLYVDGVLVDNPVTIERGAEDKTVVVTATAQAEGELISETATMEITIPAIGTEPEDPHMVGHWLVLLDENDNEEWVVLYPSANNPDNWVNMYTFHHQPWGPIVRYYFVVDGVRYGAEEDMQPTAMGPIEETVQNPLYETEYYYTIEGGFTYTLGMQDLGQEKYVLCAQGGRVGIDELNGDKTVAGVRYFNMAGQEMQEANGMTIVVTTYTDGTVSTVKVMK